MRKLFIFVILFASLSANAQEHPLKWEIVAGMNMSKMATFDSKVGFHAGVKSELSIPSLADEVYVNAAALLSLKGTSVDYGELGTGKSNAYYLEIPIHLGYKYALNDNFSVFGEAGPYIAYGLFGKTTATTTELFSDEEYSTMKYNTFDSQLKRFDFGLGLKVGVELKKKYSLSIGYDFGLTDLYKGMTEEEDDDTIDLTPKMKNKNLTISLGYKF